jgi:hypothetical protein
MTRRAITTFLAALTTVAACQRQKAETAPTPITAATASEPSEVATHTKKWSITPTDHKLNYQSTRTVALQQITATVQPRDSFTTTVDFSITPKRSSSAASYAVEIQSIHNTAAEPVVHVPFSFSGHLSDGKLKIDALNGLPLSSVIDCTNGELSFAGLTSQVIISIPTELETGNTWSDSLSTAACTGPIPGTLSVTRTYKALGSTRMNGLEAIMLELDEKTTLTSEGSQEQHRVQIRGTGSGKGRLFIDAATGAVLSSSTDRLALVAITASGREQRFQQHVNETLVRVQ